MPPKFAQWSPWPRHNRSRSHAGDQSEVVCDRRAAVQHLAAGIHHPHRGCAAPAKKADGMECLAGGIRMTRLVFLGSLWHSETPRGSLHHKTENRIRASRLLEGRQIIRLRYSGPDPQCCKDQQQCGREKKSLCDSKTEVPGQGLNARRACPIVNQATKGRLEPSKLPKEAARA